MILRIPRNVIYLILLNLVCCVFNNQEDHRLRLPYYYQIIIWVYQYKVKKCRHITYNMSRGAFVRLLRLEHALGEDHQQVDAAHQEHAAPEAHHADDD